jgi:hypothetical protein
MMDAQKIRAIWNFILHNKLGQIRKVEKYLPKNLMQHVLHGKKKVETSFSCQQKNKDDLRKTWENLLKVPKKLLTRMVLQFLMNMRG